MSLVRACIRLAVAQALRERCWKSLKVYDSDNRPLELAILADREARPYAVVYTGADSFNEDGGDDMRRLTFVVEVGVAAPVPTGVDGEPPTVAIPAQSDAGFELTVDALDRQVTHAITDDPDSRWGELLRRLALGARRSSSQRGGAAEGGSRWAARQISFDVSPILEPPHRVKLASTHPMLEFIAAAKQVTELLQAALFIESQLAGPLLADWREGQAWLALTQRGVRGIGIAPPDVAIPDHADVPLAEEITDVYDPYSPEPPKVEGIP